MATGLTLALRLGSELDEVIPFGGASTPTAEWVLQLYDLTNTQWVNFAEVVFDDAEFESAGTNRLRWIKDDPDPIEFSNTSGDSITFSEWRLVLIHSEYQDPVPVIPVTGFGETGTEEVVLENGEKITLTEVILEVVS